MDHPKRMPTLEQQPLMRLLIFRRLKSHWKMYGRNATDCNYLCINQKINRKFLFSKNNIIFDFKEKMAVYRDTLLQYDEIIVDKVSTYVSDIPHGKSIARYVSKTIDITVTIAMACLVGVCCGPHVMMAFLMRWSIITTIALCLKDVMRWPRPQSATLQEHGNPSTHTTLAISLLYDILPPYVSVTWGIVMALARVALSEHFVTDVVMGGLLGWVIAAYVIKTPWELALFLDANFEAKPLQVALLCIGSGIWLYTGYLYVLYHTSYLDFPPQSQQTLSRVSFWLQPKRLAALFRLPSGRSLEDVMLAGIGPNLCVACCGLALHWAPLISLRYVALRFLSLLSVLAIAGAGCVFTPTAYYNKLVEVIIIALALASCVWLLG